jgi:hypothetical protein
MQDDTTNTAAVAGPVVQRGVRPLLVLAATLGVLLMTGCADQVTFADAAVRTPVGFWRGLWHGMIAPFAWVFSLFMDDVAIYAIYNNGGWYDFGFVLGVGALTGGSSRAA